ncbi:hypothetical protein LINPERHAP2_LOCUS31880, partial [Linum perenne]
LIPSSSKNSLSSSPIRRLPNLSGYLPLRPIFSAATTTTSNHIVLTAGSKFFVLCLLSALGRQQLSTVSSFHLSTTQIWISQLVIMLVLFLKRY